MSRDSEMGRSPESVRNSGDMGPASNDGFDDSEREAELQREGNLGNERNYNEPDSERQGRRRGKLNR